MAISNISNGEQANSVRTKLNSTINQVNTNTTNVNNLTRNVPKYPIGSLGFLWVENITTTEKTITVSPGNERLLGIFLLFADSNNRISTLTPYFIPDGDGTAEFIVTAYSTSFTIKPNTYSFTIKSNKSTTVQCLYFPFTTK